MYCLGYCCYCSILSHVQLFETPSTAARQASLCFTISWSLLRFISIELVMLSNHLILCYSLLHLPSIFPSIKVFFQWVSSSYQVAKKYRSFNISSSNEYSQLNSFRIYQFDLLAVQGILKSLFQHHSSKASVLWHSAFFLVQLSYESEVAQSCLTLCNPMDCSLPGSSVHGIFEARVLEWPAISFSRGSSRPRDWTQVFHIVGRSVTIWATREVRNFS